MLFNFSPGEIDEVCQFVCERLKGHCALTENEVRVILLRVIEGQEYLSRRYHEWWKYVTSDEIDVGVPHQSPRNLVLARFHVDMRPGMMIDAGESARNGFTPIGQHDEEERRALNACWAEIIEYFPAKLPYGKP